MKRKEFSISYLVGVCLFLFICQSLSAQITSYQYRIVSPDKMDEYVKRETTYWSKVARKAFDKGNLTFWALLVKIGGTQLDNSPNVLLIITYNDVDGDLNNVWNAKAVFPDVSMDKISTTGISKVVGEYFLKNSGWQQSSKANPDKDFNYLIMVYHNSTSPNSFIDMENRHWGPFIKSAMDKNQTAQVAWGNAIVLSPSGPDVKFNSVSYDLFPTLKSTLMQDWTPNTVFPIQGLDSLSKIAPIVPTREVYKIVKVEAKN